MRNRPLIDARFHDTYRLAGFVRGVLRSPFGEHLRLVSDFFADGGWTEMFVAPYPEVTSLHHFVDYVVRRIYYAENVQSIDLDYRKSVWSNFSDLPEARSGLAPHVLPVEAAFEAYGIEEGSFVEALQEQGRDFAEATDDDLFAHYQELALGQPFDDLVSRVTGEVFHVLFGDREALMHFALIAESVVSEADPVQIEPDAARHLNGVGTLHRAHMPSWVRQAVFFRDRGQCMLCRRDLTGLLAFGGENVGNYDHIVPLAKGGQNDLTNIQLLCEGCNLGKGDRTVTTSSIYDAWAPPAPAVTP